MRSCVFCQIVSGAAPGHVVLDEPDAIAFLDIRPLFHGHVLLAPRAHVETLPDLAPDAVGPLFLQARRLAVAVKEAMGAQGTFVAMNNTVSQSVPHLHIHVVPRTRGDGLRGFFWPRTTYAEGEADAVAAKVRARVAAGSEESP